MTLKQHTGFLFFGLSLAACSGAFGQAIPFLAPGNVEVGGFAGVSAGIGRTAAGVGGNVAVAASRHVMPYFEATYFPDLLNRNVTQPFPIAGVPNASGTALVKTSFTDFHGGLHLRTPISSTPSVVPYFAIGAGVLRRSKTSATFTFNIPNARIDPITDTIPSESEFAINFGGGIRWYASENFGTRIEVKGYKPSGKLIAGTADPFFKVTFGVFYYFK